MRTSTHVWRLLICSVLVLAVFGFASGVIKVERFAYGTHQGGKLDIGNAAISVGIGDPTFIQYGWYDAKRNSTWLIYYFQIYGSTPKPPAP